MLEIKGKIIVAFPEATGTSKAGNAWKKREYVLETLESYPKKIFFDFFGDRADAYPLNVGDQITLFFDVDSREYMGRWYVSIRGIKAEPDHGATAPLPGAPAPAANGFGGYPAPPPIDAPAGGNNLEDLPF